MFIGDGLDGVDADEEGGQEPQTLPCGGNDPEAGMGAQNSQPIGGYHWTLSNWGAGKIIKLKMYVYTK